MAVKHEKVAESPRTPQHFRLCVEGFKSLRDKMEIDVLPLTLLCGANSAGKSSCLQPLLLLKQTLEVPYDPGPLFLDGPNVRCTSLDQLLWRGKLVRDRAEEFRVGIRTADETVALHFQPGDRAVALARMSWSEASGAYEVKEGQEFPLTHPTLNSEVFAGLTSVLRSMTSIAGHVMVTVQRRRCWLEFAVRFGGVSAVLSPLGSSPQQRLGFASLVPSIIHLPGLRGNPERAYRVSQVSGLFPGVFQDYVASVIASWKDTSDGRLSELGESLAHLGLTWKVDPKRLDETRVQLRVGRLPSAQPGGASDLVDIADVGFGVGQVLPVAVALLVASPGQIVYLEQPEIHLHPRAQVGLADLLLRAARRGVFVIAETHSSLLLRAIQRRVAESIALHEKVNLHWFARDGKTGASQVYSTRMDATGRPGEWPEDFGEVEMDVEERFLDSSLKKLSHE